MKPDLFDVPVRILVGLGFPAEVKSVTDAKRFLDELPHHRRDVSHQFLLKVCIASLAGAVDPETVQGLFVAYAEKHDLLAPEVPGCLSIKGNSIQIAR